MDHVEAGEKPNGPLIRAPLAGAAAALVLGIVAGRHMPLPTVFWGAAGAAAFMAAAVTLRRAHLHLLTTICVLACVLAIGAAHARLAYFSVADDDIATYTGPRPMLATVRGQVATSPMIYHPSGRVRFGYAGGPRTSFILAATEIHTRDGWRKVSGLSRVTIRQFDDRLSAGQEVEIMCWLSRPREPSNPGQFDPAALARQTHALANVSVPAADGVAILSRQEQPWHARILWHLRAAARQHLSDLADEQTGSLVNALVIGQRHPVLREMNRQMVRTGIAHFLSISGMHLGVFLGFVYLLCRLVAFAPRRAAVIVLVVLAAYMLLAEPNTPLLRSAIMAAAICSAVIFRRRLHPLNALAMAAIVLLALDPLQLFSAGFQLSFAIVGGLIVLRRPVRNAIFGRLLRTRGLMVFRGDQRAQRWLHYTAGNWLMGIVAISIAAYVTAAPLAAYHFGIFSPYAPLLSMLLLPLVAAVLVPGYLSMALALPMPNLSHHVGHLSAAAAKALTVTVEAASKLPAAGLEMRPVPGAWALSCYVVIALVLLHRRIRFGRAWAAAAIVALAAVTVCTQLPSPAPKAAELHLLAIGDGQCALLRTPSGESFIFDAGTRSGFDAYAATLAPFLRERRIGGPHAAFISHANADHYSALPGLVERGCLRRVYVNDYFGRGGPGRKAEGPEAAAFLRMLKAAGVEIVRVRAGDTIRLDDRTAVEVLWPPPDKREDLAADTNESSLVLRITSPDRSILLPGDIGSIARGELLAAGANLRADALVAPHHGGWDEKKNAFGQNVLEEFYNAVAPRRVLVSRGTEPFVPESAGKERQEFYNRLKSNFHYYSTSANGWIRVTLDPNGVKVTTMR